MTTLPTQIGPYAIESEIGRGGMGVVYKATDSRLDRAVAIKALPEFFKDNPERLARFEREAKTLASLSHPNVAGIHGVEEVDGSRYLVMEYVDGETLADRLDRGPLPLDEALEVCAQIAAGVEAAHEAGVIHRDLKPANVKISSDGKAKVLDFGLARIEESSSSGSSVSQLPTLTTPHSPTTPGAILGTAPYMSPEQARGRKVDKRSDIWSFGVVLYESLTGASPFVGETATDSIGAILHKDVNLALLPPGTPRDVRHVIERCIERDRNERLRDIGDARIEIERARKHPTQDDVATVPEAKGVNVIAIAAAAIVFAALGALGATMLRPVATTPALPVLRTTVKPPEDAIAVYIGDLAGPAVLSRDGSSIAFVAKRTGEQQRIYLRLIDEPDAQPIRGTEGATFPFWSWDGKSIAYFAGGDLRIHNLTTRTNQTVCRAPGGRGGAWLADDTILFAPDFQSTIHRVALEGGDPTPVTTMIEGRHTSHRWPRATPDGSGFIYLATNHEPGRLDETAVMLWRPDLDAEVEITRAYYAASIVNDHLLVVRDNELEATPIDAKSGRLLGEPTTIVTGIATDLTTWLAAFSAASNGALVFHESFSGSLPDQSVSGGSTFGESHRTSILQRDGRPVFIVADGVPQNTVAFSPDTARIAISAAPPETPDDAGFDIWVYPVPTGVGANPDARPDEPQVELEEPPRRLTFMQGAEVRPKWSPDGQWIVFGRVYVEGDELSAGLYRVRASGGQPELLLGTDDHEHDNMTPTHWTKDGRYIVFNRGSWLNIGINDLYLLDVETRESTPLVVGDGDQFDGRVSPDGRWLAYGSNETGAWEVYVAPFAPGWQNEQSQGLPTPREGARWRISIASGGLPRWHPSGRELFYISASGSLISVNVDVTGVEFNHDVGTALFAAHAESGVDLDISASGDHFAINSSVEEQLTDISVLMNWQELLKD